AEVSYRVGSAKYKREYFGNYPSGMMVYRFSSSGESNYSVTFQSPHIQDAESFENNMYTYLGHINDIGQAIQSSYKVQTDGKVSFSQGVLTVQGARELVLFHTAATDYLMEYPHYRGNDYSAQIASRYAKIRNRSFKDMKEEHMQD